MSAALDIRFFAAERSGTVLMQGRQRSAYSPYGANGQRLLRPALGFTGQIREPAGGYLLGNGKRLYLPSQARFCQPDRLSPFGRGGINAYAYCGQDPINRHDPSGNFFSWLPNLLGAGTSTVFLSSVFNKTADTIVDLSVGSMTSAPGRLARLESVGTFWGATAGVVSNVAGLAAGGVSELGSVSVVSGMVASTAYSASGVAPAVGAGVSWVGKARGDGLSPARVALLAVDEISGLRYATRRGFPRLQRNIEEEIELGMHGSWNSIVHHL